MSEVTEFFRMQQRSVLSTINTALLCKVLSYNENSRTAKLQPLYKNDDGPFPVLEDVPVLQHVTDLQAPNIVCVVFSKFPLDDALSGRITDQTDNMYRAHDAIVVGVL